MLIKISDVLKELPDFGAKLEPFHPVDDLSEKLVKHQMGWEPIEWE